MATNILVTKDWLPDPSCLKDSMSRYITQGLFLEINYDASTAIYTLKDHDYEYQGKVFPSLRRLFLEMEDPTGYYFSQKYLWGWEHWNKILENKMLFSYIEPWFDELEVRLRAKGINAAIKLGLDNLSAARWLADGKWNSQMKGRVNKPDKTRERQIREAAAKEAAEDRQRVVGIRDRKPNG